MEAVGLTSLLAEIPSANDPDAALIVGPLLISNALAWALWGVLSIQLYLFVHSAIRARVRSFASVAKKGIFLLPSRDPNATATGAERANSRGRRRRFGFRRRGGAGDILQDVNPWTMSFTAPSSNPNANENAYPMLNKYHGQTQAQAQHARQQSSKSNISSFDPYALSPTAADGSLDLPLPLHRRQREDPLNLDASTGLVAQFPARPAASSTPASSLSQLLAHVKDREAVDQERVMDVEGLEREENQRVPSPSLFVRATAYVLYVLVCVQVVLSTVQVWRIAVGGWGLQTAGLPSNVSVRWVGVVVADCLCPIVFLITMLYFLYSIFLFSPDHASTFAPSKLPPSGPKARTSGLRPLSLVKAKLASAGSQVHLDPAATVAPYAYPLDLDAPLPTSEADFRMAGSLRARDEGAGHVQPVPGRWALFMRRVHRAFGSQARFRWGRRESRKPPRKTGAGARLAMSAQFGVLAVVVAVFGLVACAKSFKQDRPVGTPPALDAIANIWLVGMLVLDAVVCGLLCLLLVRSGAFSTTTSWLGRTARFLGEAGGAQLVVALLALVLVAVWRDGKPRSTIMLVPTALLPALYANTVLLHATRSYTSVSLFSASPFLPNAATAPMTRAYSPSTVKRGYEDKYGEDIEMGLRGVSVRMQRGPEAASATRVVDLTVSGLGAAGTSTGSGTYSTTADSSGGGTAALRAQALAYGAQREREEAARRALVTGAEAKPAGQFQSQPQPGVQMYMERDSLGESSTGLAGAMGAKSGADAGVGRNVGTRSVRSRMSGLSQGALSLELPVFRRGHAYGYDANGLWEDDSDSYSDLSSYDADDGTWDYGYAVNLANAEREKEREERERATTMLSASSAAGGSNLLNVTGTQANVLPERRWQVPGPKKRSSYPALTRSRASSRRRSAYQSRDTAAGDDDDEGDADEEDDRLSMLSSVSRRTRSRHSHAHHHIAHPLAPFPVQRLLPRMPASAPSTEDVSVAGSVLVIGRRAEPSIIEPSVFRAASVAATRASTGSAWSSYTYPKPMQLPDLDTDLQMPGSADSAGAFNYGGGGAALDAVGEQDLGDGLGRLTGADTGARGDSPHPYSAAAAADDDEDARLQREAEMAKRRWHVHPLKRMVEMGRLRR